MKCFFTLSGTDFQYIQMAKVLVRSALANTDLELFCVYDGEDRDFTRWLRDASVDVIKWKISFLEELILEYEGDRSIDFCRGTYLCMELPKILAEYGVKDEHVLYVDTDTMFSGPVELRAFKPHYFASSSDWEQNEWSRFSTGVIVMNLPNLLGKYPGFVAHLKKYKFNFTHTRMGPCDQGAWNTYYKNGEHERLDPLYDWKPWWGINPDAKIVHFSGPKPQEAKRLLNMDKPRDENEQLQKFMVSENPEAYKHYIRVWKSYLA